MASVASGRQDCKRRSGVPSLVCAILASLTTGGTTYAFGLYGSAMKKSLGLSQSQLDTISTSFFFAGMFSWLPGMIVDKCGPRFSMSLGGLTGWCALLSYWGVTMKYVIIERDWVVTALSILGICVFLSNALVTGSVFKIIMATCGPGSKGSAVGVAKGYVGLGAGLYASIFESIRSPGSSDLDFLPMAATFAIICVFIPAVCMLPPKSQINPESIRDESTPMHFIFIYSSLAMLASTIVTRSLASINRDSQPGSEDHMPNYAMALLLVLMWLGPILACLALPRRRDVVANDPDDSSDDDDTIESTDRGIVTARSATQSLDDSQTAASSRAMSRRLRQQSFNSTKGVSMVGTVVVRKDRKEAEIDPPLLSADSNAEEERMLLQAADPRLPNNEVDDDDDDDSYTLFQMLRTPSCLLMLWTITILVGGGTLVTNNMGQMVESLGFPDAVTPASLALFSVAQSGARVATGALSEAALDWKTRGRCCIDQGIPRPFFYVISSLLAFISHFGLSFAVQKVPFIIGCILTGAAFGMTWPLMVLVTGELFGTAHVGANYMFYDGFSSAIGTLILSKLVAGELYEHHIDRASGNKYTCYGPNCFRFTHLIVAGLSICCIGTSMCLMYTSRRIYNKRRLHSS
jgi:Nodulin-like